MYAVHKRINVKIKNNAISPLLYDLRMPEMYQKCEINPVLQQMTLQKLMKNIASIIAAIKDAPFTFAGIKMIFNDETG